MKTAARTATIVGIAVASIGVLASLLPPVQTAELFLGLKSLYTLRGSAAPPPEVIVVGIDTASAEVLGIAEALGEERELTGWPRALHAELVDKLHAAGAAVVAFDIHFKDPQHPGGDRKFAEAIRNAGNVILYDFVDRDVLPADPIAADLGISILRDRTVPPHEPLRAAARTTATFPLPTVPERTDQYWTFLPMANDAPTLPVAAFAEFAAAAAERIETLVAAARPDLRERLDGVPVGKRMAAMRQALSTDPELAREVRARLLAGGPRDSRTTDNALKLLDLYTGPESHFLNYYGRPRTITTVPVSELLLGDPDESLPWRNSLVLVGFSERTQPDQADEFSSVFSEQSGLRLSGVEIAATALANLIEGRVLEPLPLPLQLLVVLVAGLALGASFLSRSVLVSVVALALLVAGYLLFAEAAFERASSWWPLVVPTMIQAPLALVLGLALVYSHAAEKHAAISRGASRYLPADLVARMAENPDAAARSSELVDGVCLVTDIEGFTAYSETIGPQELEVALNRYYEALFGIIDRNGGLVTDIVGDSMVAVWRRAEPASPLSGPLLAALEIRDRLAGDQPAFPRTRVGIRGGRFILGTVGALEHLEFRAVGEVVNSAARIQALNKRLGTTVLAERDCLPTEGVVTREIGSFQLPGMQRPLAIAEPVAFAAAVDEDLAQRIETFGAALEAFRRAELERAAGLFAALARDFDDGPSRFYLGLIRARQTETPERAFDAIVRLTD